MSKRLLPRMLSSLMVVTVIVICLAPVAAERAEVEGGDQVLDDHVRHALVQRSVGFYSVFLPPGYATDGGERTYSLCILLHGMGGTEAELAASVLADLGRDDVIYLAPRAPHAVAGGGFRGWPMRWSEWPDPTFPRADVEAADVPSLYTEWIARCLADARKRYRISSGRVVVFGHSEGATFAHRFAYDHPKLVKAYFAHAGSYDYATEGSADVFARHNVYPLIAHCKDDAAQKFEGSELLVAHFRGQGLAHEALFLEEGGHGLVPAVIKRARAFVDQWCREAGTTEEQ
jgi:predicted esterase